MYLRLSPVSPLYYSISKGAGIGQSPYPYGCMWTYIGSLREGAVSVAD